MEDLLAAEWNTGLQEARWREGGAQKSKWGTTAIKTNGDPHSGERSRDKELTTQDRCSQSSCTSRAPGERLKQKEQELFITKR